MEVGMMIGEENDKAIMNELKVNVNMQIMSLKNYIRSNIHRMNNEDLEYIKEYSLNNLTEIINDVVIDQEFMNPTLEDLMLKRFFDNCKKKVVNIFDELSK